MNKWIGYQLMTIAAKKVGGPIALLAITLGIGALLDEGGKILWKKAKKFLEGEERKLIKVTALEDGREDDCVIHEGDIVKVGEIIDQKIALVEINDYDEPYYVSLEFLKKHTNYGENKNGR